MKITDMNLICLEECFEYLQLKDILSVADTTKRLRKAAQGVYLRKYGEKTTIEYSYNQLWLCRTNKPSIKFDDLKTPLQLLRCFGHMIHDMEINFEKSNRGRVQKLLMQLNEYCAESLIKLTFIGVKKNELNILTKPFTKIQEVVTKMGFLPENGLLCKLFPKMEEFGCIAFDEKPIGNINCLTYHFPHLKRFGIIFTLKAAFMHRPMAGQMAEFLRLNPQLEKLSLHNFNVIGQRPFFDLKTFRNVIEPMENLEFLKLKGNCAYFYNSDGTEIHLKSIKRFELTGQRANTIKYPFRFDRLEFFHSNDKMKVHFYDFIERHPTITKLLIERPNVDFLRLAKAQPLLSSMVLHYNISIDDVLFLVSIFKLLEILQISPLSLHNGKTDELRARLGHEWHVSVDVFLREVEIHRVTSIRK
ncbi:uncharacterized protein LOC129572383 [Sitodiplosis mosellana]|uniref:uncharacterized protein LOC129572383 n=1 Tax=Sitodiplosis mosellana TaxID=263140 RepID=UPI00244406B9|nr:uncharacterized protein LOC129572383 [Sitodiplosis mosellana]